MVNHGIGVEAQNQVSFVPADVAANNIVANSKLSASAKQCFHITRDEYANMIDIVQVISNITGRRFEMFKFCDFVPEVIRRCTKDDPLFPLLDFLIGSVDSISSMEFKRYDSSRYQAARKASELALRTPHSKIPCRGILRLCSGNH